MPDFIRKSEIIVFAGPNGSGKTTITKLAKTIEPYINTDDAYRIFKKRKDEFFYWESEFWNKAQIEELVGIEL